MTIKINKLIEKLKAIFKLEETPIAFFYTDDAPQEVYNPKKTSLKRFPCIIQFLNGVRQGKTLVLGRQSKNLCPGGLSYLGFRKRMSGAEYYLSTGITSPKEENITIEGEKIVKTPELAKTFYDSIPFKKSPAKYAVFMPLNLIDLKIYTPQLVIIFVKMDKLAGLIQLANFDTNNKTILGVGSGCSTLITEPIAEIEKNEVPRAVIGMLTDIIARRHIKSDEAVFTIGYDRIIQLYENIDDSFLKTESWEVIYNRITN